MSSMIKSPRTCGMIICMSEQWGIVDDTDESPNTSHDEEEDD